MDHVKQLRAFGNACSSLERAGLNAAADHIEALERDAARLDYLEAEMVRELTGPKRPLSLFRRNVPITRAAIDEAMASECHAKRSAPE